MNFWIFFGCYILFLYFLLRKDIKNYRYTRKCFRLMVDEPEMQRRYRLRRSRLGVLYMYWTVPSDTPLQYHDQLLQGELSYLEDAMGGMQLWGIVNNERREMGETDSKQTVYLIKFMPVFQKISARFFIIWGIIGVVLWWLINKFELWQYMDGLIEFIKGLAN